MSLSTNSTRLFCIAATLIALAFDLLAVGAQHLDIGELVKSADVIVIADVSEKLHSGNADPVILNGKILEARQYSSRLKVRTILKGACPPDITATYPLPLDFAGYLPLQSGVRIVFLRHNRGGYEPANPYYPDLPASGSAFSTIRSTNDDAVASGLVFHELANAIASATVPASIKLQLLQKDYAIPTSDYFISALKQGIASAVSQQLKEFLQAQLLMRGDLSELPRVTDALIHNAVTAEGKYALLYAIGNYVKDSRAVPALLPLQSSADPGTRISITEALWHIADPGTTKDLVRALTDSEREVRYYAVRALADISGENLWGPSIPEFQEHEQSYLQHWKNWASETGQDQLK